MRRFVMFAASLALIGAFSACGGGGGTSGGGGGMVTPPSNGAPAPSRLPTSIRASSGATDGVDNLFTPNDGNAGPGSTGQSIHGIPCKTTMAESNYHIHVFIGFVDDGQLVALPDGMGMKNPAPESSAGVTNSASCFYYLHTHDAAGILHVEDPSTASRTLALHTFGQFLDIWGQPFSSSGVGPFSGPVKIYTSGSKYRGQGGQNVSSSTYAQYGGDAHSIPLYGHEVIWIEIGPTFVAPQNLPSINFTY
jgi:hypothetical protein